MVIFEIDGKEYPFKFSQGTLLEYGKISGFKTMNEINESISGLENLDVDDFEISRLENMGNLVLAGFIVGAKIKGQECDLNMYSVLDMISEKPDFMEKINQHIFKVSENKIPDPKAGK